MSCLRQQESSASSLRSDYGRCAAQKGTKTVDEYREWLQYKTPRGVLRRGLARMRDEISTADHFFPETPEEYRLTNVEEAALAAVKSSLSPLPEILFFAEKEFSDSSRRRH